MTDLETRVLRAIGGCARKLREIVRATKSHDRAVDKALQALRKQGKIKYVRRTAEKSAGWELVP